MSSGAEATSGSNAVDPATMRLEYETTGISEDDFAPDPSRQFAVWFDEAVSAAVYEPNAMVVSTVDAAGRPWSRYVLLKGFSDLGFDFFTNYGSNKSKQLTARPTAAVTFGWLELHRQVNIAGAVERLPDAESEGYWAIRTRGSQLGAWASAQSSVLSDRSELVQSYEAAEKRFPDVVPRPPHWGGWRVVPDTVEFWQGRRNRMHDRLRYVLADGGWDLLRLAP